jgi:ATP-dependent helicase/nuclease subunit B
MTTSIMREFLGWDRPLLESAVEWLARKYSARGELDLSPVIVVVPGRRAGRRLLELLVQRAEADRVRLTPPHIETLGALPEQLYPLQRPLASDLVQQLTWAKALRESKRSVLAKIIPRPPTDDDALAWWSLGTLLWGQHRELAADGHDFGDVVKLGRGASDGFETDRWQALHRIQTTYLRTLDELRLWDAQTARLVAIQQREPHSEHDLVLVGTVDMNQATREILDLVADRVSALIATPENRADWFDSHGCLVPEKWCDAPVEILAERVRVCEGPAEQAEQVARELSAFDGRFRTDEIVIGLADDRLGPFVERQLATNDVTTRWIEGTKLADSGPCRLLLAVAEVLERDRFEGFASLVRHPDLDECLTGRLNLEALDQSFHDHLPLGPDTLLAILEQPKPARLRPRRKGRTAAEPVETLPHRLLGEVRDLLAPLRIPARPLNDWAEPLRSWASSVYGRRQVDESSRDGRVLVAALKKLNEVLDELADVPPSVAPVVAAADAIRCAVRRMSEELVPPEATENALELLGWLELPLDDTPAAIVTSFNEGFVPTSLNSDLFLPNELRHRLGLNDNLRRYARDAYAVTLLQQARREVVWLVGRRDADGNPLIPSRLLFAVDSEQLPERVLRLMDREGETPAEPKLDQSRPEVARQEPRPPEVVCLQIPQPQHVAALLGQSDLLQPKRELTLSVTAFKSYLTCPYRYFLRHELGLGTLDDRAVELDGLAFGEVLHKVLHLFGESDDRDSDDESRVRRCLLEVLNEVANDRFGPRRRAAVNVQFKQMESRLEVFATWQAKWRREGWCIEHVERSIRPEPNGSDAPSFQIEDVSVWLHGRLDRVDRNEATGAWMIFDYKSGDKGDSPDESHRKKGDWIDLQLPLYRHLARSLALPDEPRLGYINLPKDLAGVGAAFAEWSPDDLADADAKAKQVALSIARREFWPMKKIPPGQFREFDDICQVGVFGAE